MKLDETKIYYNSHPCTTCGDIDVNKAREEECYRAIRKAQPHMEDCNFFRPLTQIPPSMTDHDEAMGRCLSFLGGCDAIILCGNWEFSSGCQMEHCFAEFKGLEILEYDEVVK